ncbi:MAG TPA: bifunctional phosphoribosyl-AMP cyclohydrolase/phosphoribosyl-ATP diphosphatase HisIE [Candidatus Paceibacterota bacterium]|nr:bifunctional phosphoribosyl-AMP cyclohydrolase/phosphoribosyl-ATP diphosphatase HisIE [Candidatus Paceibacterota bacterium]
MKKLNIKKINWNKVDGLVPAIIQDSSTGLVLMLGYMNKEALAKTMKTGFVWFYSRTKKRLWMKGEKSKNNLKVLDIRLDCDNDTLLIKALARGPICHTGDTTCFSEIPKNDSVRDLFTMIMNRKQKLPKKSYTTSLFKGGLDKISLKVAEESLEVIHAAQKQTHKRLTEESVDLLYHLFVLLAEKNVTLEQVESEITKRSK